MKTTLLSRISAFALLVAASATVGAFPAPIQSQEADLSPLQFRELGPATMGGRITDLAVVESDPRIIYASTATAGVWKTTNHGITWDEVFRDEETSSVGDVTVAPSNPNAVWVGTGEPQNRQSSPWGIGVYRSLDGGANWTHVGLRETAHISRIQIHPLDQNVVYVAAVGNLWAANEERGVFKTTDGGTTWEKVLYIDEDTGVIDLVMDPHDPNTLFAATYQRRRTAGGFNGGGPGSGIHRTFDGGATWERLEEGLPDRHMGRIGLDIYRQNSDMIFASVEARAGGTGFYASRDRGDTWEKLSNTNVRPMYFSHVRVDPNNADRIYMGGVQLMVSDDGGRTFRNDAREVHSDHHAIWINPEDSNHLVMGSDGGVSASFDGAETWRMYDNLPLAQFYEIGINMEDPYLVCGGLQDNGTWCSKIDNRNGTGLTNADWFNIHGGDGFYAQPDPVNAHIVYAESQNGNVSRVDISTGERASIRPPEPEDGNGETIEDYRWNWNTPLILSIHEQDRVYTAANRVFRSDDRGRSWEVISPDLTRNLDRDEMPIMGEMPSDSTLSRNDGVSYWNTITTLSESPLDPDLIWIGADDGSVQMTRDGGDNWTDLTGTFPGLPEMAYVSRVEPSGGDLGTAYVSFDNHYQGDFAPYIYRTEDFGATWTPITDGLPEWSVNVVTEHPTNPNLVFAGNEVGVYYSLDRGDLWIELENNFPTVPVDDIAVHERENDLVVGTHGRGVWVLEDIAPLEHMSNAVLTAEATLFPVREAEMYHFWNPQGWPAEGAFTRSNSFPGAKIRYYVGDDGMTTDPDSDDGPADRGDDDVTLTILDSDGNEIRTLEGENEPGMHQVIWNFRMGIDAEGAPEQLRAQLAAAGPEVMPGEYTVRLDRGDTSVIESFTVVYDNRVDISRGDLQARHDLAVDLAGLLPTATLAGRALADANGQVEDAQDRLDDAANPPAELREQVDAVEEALEAVQDRLQNIGNPAGLMRQVEFVSDRPTPWQEAEADRMWQALPGVLSALNRILTDDLPALHEAMSVAGLTPDPIQPVAMPNRGG